MAIAEAEIKSGLRMTEDEFMRIPKDGPGNPTAAKFELVDGRLLNVPTDWDHDLLGLKLIGLMLPLTYGRGFMSSGQTGFRMSGGNVRAPDVSYTRKERVPGGKPPKGFGTAAPDLCIEIISPSERQSDMRRKIDDYFDSGAQQVWHIFPEAQQVTIFTSPTESQTLNADAVLDAGDILPSFSCRVGDIFTTE